MNRKAIKLMVVTALLALAVPSFAWVGTADLGIPDPQNPDDNRTPLHLFANRTLDPDTLYTLHGFVYVESGATITIPPATHIQGTPAATLIIKPGGTIMAAGEPCAPIVFTSNQLPGNRLPGDWGGVVILGNARVNQPNPVIEGGIIEGTFGGTDDHDSSGVFKYVRIEFPGYRFQLDNEINGLTMGGVGDGTELHHIQVSYSFDDSYEWFGGTVNAHHLVAMGGTDDEFDTDFGYRGELQFCFGLRDPDYSDPTGSSNGFESDNDGSGSTAWPQTHPKFSNVTMIGPEYVGALPIGNTFSNSGVLRRNSRISCYNSVIAGYPRGLSVRDNSIAMAAADTLQFHNTEVTGHYEYSTSNIHDTGRWPAIGTWFLSHANLDTLPRAETAVGLGASISLTNPMPIPQAGSVLIGTADWSDAALHTANFDSTVHYRGAFDPQLPMDQQWTACWTNFDPQGADYAAVSAVGDEVPTRLAAASNYPNPFNPSTTISFSVPRKGYVSVRVYDMRGREVAVLHEGVLDADDHSVVFQGNNLSSGTYFYRITGNGFAVTEKMQLVK
jgi:hypothetical protein